MSKIIQDSLGEDMEVFTGEELQSQREAAIEEFKIENPDKSGELETLQSELEAKEEELAKLKNKDFNFANLRKQKDTAESKIEGLKKEIDDKIGLAKKEVMEGMLKGHYNEGLKILAEDNEELKKKIEFNYNRIQDIPTTESEITKKLRDAWLLSVEPENLDKLNTTVLSSGGVGKLNIKSSEEKLTPEEKELGKRLASAGGIKLEEKDFEIK